MNDHGSIPSTVAPLVIDLEPIQSPLVSTAISVAVSTTITSGVNILSDIDERQLSVPPPVVPTVSSRGDIDERIIPRAAAVISDMTESKVVSLPEKVIVPPVLLDDKQTEEIKIILSKIIATTTTAPVGETVVSISKDEEIVDLVDVTEPLPPDDPPLPPLNPPPSLKAKNKIFEDSPFQKNPVLKLGASGATVGKMKININISTKILPAATDEIKIEEKALPSAVAGDLHSFKDIDERMLPSAVKESQQTAVAAPSNVPPPVLLTQPPPPLPSVPLRLPPPKTTGSVVVNLNVPPPRFIPALSRPQPNGPPPTIRFPPLTSVQLPAIPSSSDATLTPQPPTSSGGGNGISILPPGTPPRSVSRQSPGSSIDRNDRESSGFRSRWENRRRGGWSDDRKRYRSRSRSRSRGRSRSRSRSRSRDRNKRRRRYSRSRSPARRSSRRNRSRSRSKSLTL